MLDPAALTAFALLGLAGSLHCVGMCGGFVLSVTRGQAKRRAVVGRALAFGLGKALTYAVLGLAVAGLFGRSLEIVGVQRALAWLAGLLLILLGLAGLGLGPSTSPIRHPAVARLFGRMKNAAEGLGGTTGAFAAGVVTGLLPCGLSWGAFVLATQTDPASAAVGLFAFGLATTPALAALAVGWALVSPRTRSAGARALGLLLIVFGVLTISRGGTPASARAGVAPDCCEQESVEGTQVLQDGGDQLGDRGVDVDGS